MSIGITAATVAVVLLPFVAMAPGEAWFSIRAQLARGVQVESLPGSIAVSLGVAADKVGLGTLGVGVAEGGTGDVRSADVTGALGQVTNGLTGGTTDGGTAVDPVTGLVTGVTGTVGGVLGGLKPKRGN